MPTIHIVLYCRYSSKLEGDIISTLPSKIKKILLDPSSFDDNMHFKDPDGTVYSLDELIGRRIQVGSEIFTVPSDIPLND